MPNTSVPAAATGLPAFTDHPLAALRRLRAEAEAQIERLIALLDDIDADPELEDNELEIDADFEPVCGAPERHPPWSGQFPDGCPFPRWVHEVSDQERWAQGNDDEREEENEHGGDVQDEPHDAEAEGDGEPDLGAPEHENQVGWAYSATYDMGEHDLVPAVTGPVLADDLWRVLHNVNSKNDR